MIEDMYNVIYRINEIKKRFGLGRIEKIENKNNNFQMELNKQIENNSEDIQNKNSQGKVSGKMSLGEIKSLADSYAKQVGIPSSLVNAVIKTESGYNPNAVSEKGAKGLMQLMPPLIREFGINNPFNPEENIKGGVAHLKRLLEKYGWDYKKALGAYNAGEKEIDEHKGVPRFKETQEYIKKVISSYLENRE